MRAVEAFNATNAGKTVAYQNELIQRGELGQIAFGLFRAQKRSTKAKGYRGRLRRASYDGKNEAIVYLDAALTLWDGRFGINWGWKTDESREYHSKVLYVDLPDRGQCSFHSASEASSKRYEGQWDNSRPVVSVVLDFCEFVMQSQDSRSLMDTDLMPFGSHVGKCLGDIDCKYWDWLADWDGLESWTSIQPFVMSRAARV